MTEEQAVELLAHIKAVAEILGVSEKWSIEKYASDFLKDAMREAKRMVGGKKRVLRIRQYIGERCLTQRRAAELCGLTQQAFSRIVRGVEPPYPKRGKNIADALGWEGDWHELFEEVEV